MELRSEDAAESIHAEWNRLCHRYTCVRGEVRKLKLMDEALMVERNKQIVETPTQHTQRIKRAKQERLGGRGGGDSRRVVASIAPRVARRRPASHAVRTTRLGA